MARLRRNGCRKKGEIEMSEVLKSFVGLMAIIWLFGWFASIWAYHVQFFLTGTLALILGLLADHAITKKEQRD